MHERATRSCVFGWRPCLSLLCMGLFSHFLIPGSATHRENEHRHCERSEAIHLHRKKEWIASLTLAMTWRECVRSKPSALLRRLCPHLHLAVTLRPAFAVVLRAALHRH